ncbi:hypothetical protein SPRG_20029 [Saprolegnia parasitica CBS 223.65]|uniref:Hydrogen voltage-gated channel 1 n=1 Tax=Saprolegnia parasitica (strain CBS 223.65) TaxID=695850 RepID=A0A067CQM6_SAPPC|nr:hypothetical protein SPRG_20029 [Saprolegnia parasitica CBS 223.65]KDO28826.1 hypothetical protein SPRG_20029 [Saprolegnia parasitica CBS 223.65]|eukprot:XP_012200557.1 hypothetical protein SPRG_20029 [Saprolegnia parasitica CBS 223.65]
MTKDDVAVTPSWSRRSVGVFLESPEAQLVMIALITLDVVSALLSAYLDLGAALGASAVVANRVLQSLSGFTQVAFLLEMAALVAVFELAFFSHLGYCVDMGVVVFAVSYELHYASAVMRVLGCLRYWRVCRFVWTLLANEAAKTEAVAAQLDAEKQKTQQLELMGRQLQESLSKEHSATAQLNRTLQDYQDEIDTLKEALTIAATAMARQAQNELDEAESDDDDDDDDTASALRSPRLTTDDLSEFQDASP